MSRLITCDTPGIAVCEQAILSRNAYHMTETLMDDHAFARPVYDLPAAAGDFRRAADAAGMADRPYMTEGQAPAAALPAPRAWVVFSGQTDLPWLRWLRPGFRHCFIVMHDGTHWMTVDPMLHRMEILVHRDLPRDFDLPRWLEKRGQTVIAAAIDVTRRRPAPWRPFTCVEAVKRILGLHARFVLTPWQLYSHLGGVPHAARERARRRPAFSRVLPNTLSHPLPKEIPAWAA